MNWIILALGCLAICAKSFMFYALYTRTREPRFKNPSPKIDRRNKAAFMRNGTKS